MKTTPFKVAHILDSAKSAIKDGLENLVASLGTSQDKRFFSRFVNNKRLSQDGNQAELNAMYRTNWAAGKLVDIVPDDMTREWRSFSGEIEPEMVKRLTDEEARLQLVDAFNQAHKWARLYGTAFIVMSIDDGQLPEMPLNINKIKKGGLRHIKPVDRHRLQHADVQPIGDPLSASYGYPEFYRFNQTAVKIHHSRVLRFDAVKLPYDEFVRNGYFSDSVLDRMYDAITDLSTVTSGTATMIYETNVDIVKVKGLMGYLQDAQGEELLRKRFALASQMKSFNNMMLLDSEESHESKTNAFSGIPVLIDKFGQQVVAGADIPATRFLGTQATGLNATGEGDLKNYYDKLAADQNKEYRPKLTYFDSIMAKSMSLSDDLDLDFEFDSLFQMTPKEKSEIEAADAQRDAVYLEKEVLTDVIVAKELKQKGTYTNITDDYIEELEALEDEDDDDEIGTDPDAPKIDPAAEEVD